MLPKISIVTPSYNQANFLEATIRSVVNQGYPNLEYIIVDGDSADGSIDIINKYRHKIAHVICEKDNGHADALNKGFRLSSGEIMGWINSDDMLTPWSLRAVAEIFAELPEVNWIHGTASFWNTHGTMLKPSMRPRNIYNFLVGDYAWLQQESIFWRRCLWEKAGGYIDPGYALAIDGELWCRFFCHDRLYFVETVLGGWRIHTGNRAIHNNALCHKEMKNAIEVMRSSCDSKILQVAGLVAFRDQVCRSHILKLTRLSGLAWRLISGIALAKHSKGLRVPVIRWNFSSSSWQIHELPFFRG